MMPPVKKRKMERRLVTSCEEYIQAATYSKCDPEYRIMTANIESRSLTFFFSTQLYEVAEIFNDL